MNTILFPHISLNVTNIERSTMFYKALFGVNPVKVRPGYAKFELHDPKLNFTLNERPEMNHDMNHHAVNHFGLQVDTTGEVISIGERLQRVGLTTTDEMQTTCCYARQDKTWVTDPDGISWEVFVVLSDADAYGEDTASTGATCCAPLKIENIEVTA